MQELYTVTLGDYKSVKAPKFEASVSETEIDLALQGEQQRRSTMETVDAPAENGDTVVIDYAGFLGDVQFEGGTGENYSLELGSHTFIPGFEEQLVGASAGQDVDVNVTFPEVYHSEELAGKDAVFKCKVHAVQRSRVPELNDEFAEKHFQVKDMAALRELARTTMLKQKEEENAVRAQEAVMAEIVKGSLVEVSDAFLSRHTEAMLDLFQQSLAQQDISLEMYFQYTGATMEDLRKQVAPQAMERARLAAVLTTIAEAEGISVTEEDYEGEIAALAQAYGTTVEELKKNIDESVKADIFTNMTIDRTMKKLMAEANK